MPNSIYIPSTWGPLVPPTFEPRVWDPRLTKRGVIVNPANVEGNGMIWRVAEGHFLDEHESQGRHHAYIELEDLRGGPAAGIKVRWYWDDGGPDEYEDKVTDGDGLCHFEVYSGGRAYGVYVLEGSSDMVFGMGMGYGLGTPESPKSGEHVSYKINFRRVI